jgi:hypothetical protein
MIYYKGAWFNEQGPIFKAKIGQILTTMSDGKTYFNCELVNKERHSTIRSVEILNRLSLEQLGILSSQPKKGPYELSNTE